MRRTKYKVYKKRIPNAPWTCDFTQMFIATVDTDYKRVRSYSLLFFGYILYTRTTSSRIFCCMNFMPLGTIVSVFLIRKNDFSKSSRLVSNGNMFFCIQHIMRHSLHFFSTFLACCLTRATSSIFMLTRMGWAVFQQIRIYI